MKNRRKLLAVMCAIAMGALAATVGRADDAEAVRTCTRETLDKLLAVLKRTDLTHDAKLEKVMAIVEPIFDYKSMAMLTLGRTQWERFDEAQRKEYVDLFVKQLQHAYFDKAEQFSNETLDVGNATAVGGKYQVKVSVVGKGETLSVVYKFYKRGNDWLVYDVEVEGVSLISSYRSQYAQVLKDGAPADLLKTLREKVGELESK